MMNFLQCAPADAIHRTTSDAKADESFTAPFLPPKVILREWLGPEEKWARRTRLPTFSGAPTKCVRVEQVILYLCTPRLLWCRGPRWRRRTPQIVVRIPFRLLKVAGEWGHVLQITEGCDTWLNPPSKLCYCCSQKSRRALDKVCR